MPISRLGARKALLVDLSPAAIFIAYNYNTPVDVAAFEAEAQRILVEAGCGWMVETWISQVQLAERLQTSRSQVDRLLDPDNTVIAREEDPWLRSCPRHEQRRCGAGGEYGFRAVSLIR